MNTFKKPELSDRLWVKEITNGQNILNCDAPFGTTYIWQNEYGTKICRFKDFYIVAYTFDEGSIYFDFPIGKGDLREVLDFMINYAESNGLNYSISASGSEQAELLSGFLSTDKYNETTNRNNAEYIYLSENLAYLKGRRFHSKRNHIANFKKTYKYTTEPLNKSNFDDALKVNRMWCIEHGGHKGTGSTSEECAVLKAFRHFDELGFSGMLLRVDNKPVAMTMGEEVSKDCYVVHFEKAVSGIKGAYTAINNFFSETITNYKYINREEDLGIEGLRKAKLSYKPEILLEKYIFAKK